MPHNPNQTNNQTAPEFTTEEIWFYQRAIEANHTTMSEDDKLRLMAENDGLLQFYTRHFLRYLAGSIIKRTSSKNVNRKTTTTIEQRTNSTSARRHDYVVNTNAIA